MVMVSNSRAGFYFEVSFKDVDKEPYIVFYVSSSSVCNSYFVHQMLKNTSLLFVKHRLQALRQDEAIQLFQIISP